MPIYGGTIESVTIDGKTFEVFDSVIGEANVMMNSLALGTCFTDLPGSSEAAALAHREEQRSAFSGTLEMQPIGVRGWRMLTTGRPRPPRAVTKRLNQQRRETRRNLRRCADEGAWAIDNAGFGATRQLWAAMCIRRVSVPRSLRHLLGRWIGGDR